MKHFILPVCMAVAVAAAAGSCANESQSMLEPQKINMSKFTEKNGFQLEENGVITSVVFYTPEIVRITKTPADSTKKPFVTPTVILKPEGTTVQPVQLDANGWESTGKGLFYIPLQVAKELSEAQITVWYRIKDKEGYMYKGSVSKSFPLDMTNAAVGNKQGITLTLTEDLDLLHLVYIIDPNATATEPSYSRVTK